MQEINHCICFVIRDTCDLSSKKPFEFEFCSEPALLQLFSLGFTVLLPSLRSEVLVDLAGSERFLMPSVRITVELELELFSELFRPGDDVLAVLTP